MRMTNQKNNIDNWVKLFITMFENGVDTLHSSSEYESFELLCEVLNRVSKKSDLIKFKHVVKLADPSFDEIYSNYDRIEARVIEYSDKLKTNQIETVQWMWRADLKNDSQRVSKFTESAEDLNNKVSDLKKKGLFKKFFCFPYTIDFGMASIEVNEIDGYTVYRNPNETEMDPLLDIAYQNNKEAYIIRPFGGGGIIKEANWNSDKLIKFATNHQSVNSIIVSISNEKQLSEVLSSL